MDAHLVRISKYLSKHLRHAPAAIGLSLEPGGWVRVDDLLAAAAGHRFPITREQLAAVVAGNDKSRFAFDPTGTKIKANQGHSADVELTFDRADPPPVLFHGTADRNQHIILRDGLLKMGRHHVHLSADFLTALAVGRRHGRPVVFAVDAARMAADGHPFYLSDNRVWLADAVPAAYLRIVPPDDPA